MVIKTCKICGKEFEARGNAKCCSTECSKINKCHYDRKYRQSERGKEYQKKYQKEYHKSDKYNEYQKQYQKEYQKSDKQKKYRKEYYLNNRDRRLEYQREYNKSDRGKAAQQRFKENNPNYHAEYDKEYIQNKIAELNEKYDGDLDLILKDCPTSWQVREAIMQVEYGVSYADAMYKKMELNPVCEVTGESGDLVNHHLDSFNTHPEKGADLNNLIRIKSEIHDDFHNEYGRGNNTREQWFEFLEKNRNIYI